MVTVRKLMPKTRPETHSAEAPGSPEFFERMTALFRRGAEQAVADQQAAGLTVSKVVKGQLVEDKPARTGR